MSFSASPRALSASVRVCCACASARCARFMLTYPNTALACRTDRKDRANRRDLARTDERLARRTLAFALGSELALRLVARLALVPQRPVRAHNAAQHVVRELDAPHVEALLDAQQPPVDERRERVGSSTCLGERLADALLGNAFAKAGFREQLVLDEAPHPLRLVGERAFVELGEDRVVRPGEQIGRDLGATLCDSRVVELPADEAQQRRLDFGVA